jgi:DNA-binding LacI/PurR family transcriptional regulator/DNA-binding transcriptional regulator YhcF (GntR family)
MNNATPAVASASQKLRAMASACARLGNPHLPTIRSLADTLGLSALTVWRAVAILKSEGVLSARRGGRISVVGVPIATQTLIRRRWLGLRDRLAVDITTGRYRPGTPLPSTKTLAAQHGVTCATLRKALGDLCRKGMLQPFGRRLRVPSAVTSGSGLVVVIGRGQPDGSPILLRPRGAELFQRLETDTAQSHLGLVFLPYDYTEGRLHSTAAVSEMLDPARVPREVIGFIVLTMGIQDPHPSRPDNLSSLLARLVPLGKPITLLSEGGWREERFRNMRSRGVRYITLAHNPSAGTAVGRYLLNLGHRHIGYISPFHEEVWSQNRLLGLEYAIQDSGVGARITTLTCAQPFEHYEEREYEIAAAGEIAKHLRSRPRTQLACQLRQTLKELEIVIFDAMVARQSDERVMPLLQQAVSTPQLTALVAANDQTAFVCLDFLVSHGKRVPDDVSVVSFDDTVDASRRRLTSYNFDVPRAVSASLRHILSPPERAQSMRAPVEIEGFLNVRRTAAAVGRAKG